MLQNLYLGILETFVFKVALAQDLGAVNHVGGELVVHHKSQFVLQVISLALLHTIVVNLGDTWAWSQVDVQICGVVNDGVHTDRYVGEQTVLPVALDGLCYLFAGNGYSLSHTDAGKAYQHGRVVIGYTVYGNVLDHNLAWRAAIVNGNRSVAPHVLCMCRYCCKAYRQHIYNNVYLILHL